MLKYIIFTLILIAGALLWMVFGIGVPSIYFPEAPEQSLPHTYDEPSVNFDNPTRSIENVHIYVVYFTPSDTPEGVRADDNIATHRPALESALLRLNRFHTLQLQDRSHLTYSVYPKKVIGRYGMEAYEIPKENVDGFEKIMSISSTLASVAEELEDRVFSEDGDLNDPSFFRKREDGVYSIMLILYEGDNSITRQAAAADTFYNHSPEKDKEFAEFTGLPELVSRTADVEAVDSGMIVNTSFLAGSPPYGVTIFAHEFYHTLNLPDGYDYRAFAELGGAELPHTADIMGLRSTQLFESTYLDRDVLTKMGF